MTIQHFVLHLNQETKTKQKQNVMNTQQLINYATEKSMNYKTFTDEFTGRVHVGIEWKNNDVYYWYHELLDGDLFFYERYSRNNGKSSSRFSMTECNIRKSVESFNA